MGPGLTGRGLGERVRAPGVVGAGACALAGISGTFPWTASASSLMVSVGGQGSDAGLVVTIVARGEGGENWFFTLWLGS